MGKWFNWFLEGKTIEQLHEENPVTSIKVETILNPARIESAKEIDPNGKSAHEAGSKLDAGKQRPFLVYEAFIHALQEVYNNGTFGANKYTDNGWRTVPNARQRYLEAAMRHFNKYLLGEQRDVESETHHLGAVAWNILAVLELELSKGTIFLKKP